MLPQLEHQLLYQQHLVRPLLLQSIEKNVFRKVSKQDSDGTFVAIWTDNPLETFAT